AACHARLFHGRNSPQHVGRQGRYRQSGQGRFGLGAVARASPGRQTLPSADHRVGHSGPGAGWLQAHPEVIGMTRTFHVKNFERFQHYKDRAPPWIKLYNELLDDYEFSCLQDASKLHLILIWLLASRSDNNLPYDPAWLARRINASEPVDLDALVSAGFIVVDQPLQSVEQVASKTLADCKQVARPERERETEKDAASPPPKDLEKRLFERGKEVLGKEAGGLIAKLLKAKNRNVALATAAIETASTKQNPREYVARIANGAAGGAPDSGMMGVI